MQTNKAMPLKCKHFTLASKLRDMFNYFNIDNVQLVTEWETGNVWCIYDAPPIQNSGEKIDLNILKSNHINCHITIEEYDNNDLSNVYKMIKDVCQLEIKKRLGIKLVE